MMAAATEFMVVISAISRILRRGWLRWRGCLIGALNDLVEFAAIKPDATALRAIIDLYALPLGHDERGIDTCGAFHLFILVTLDKKVIFVGASAAPAACH